MKEKRRQLKAAISDKKGAVFMMMAFIALTLIIFVFAAFETIKVFSVYFTVETNLCRLANNAVERNIDDTYRADGYNYLTVNDAMEDFVNDFHWYTSTEETPNDYVTADGGLVYGCKFSDTDEFLYMIHITSLTADRETATLKCKGRLYIANSLPGLLDKFVFDLALDIQSTNFRTDEYGGSLNITG